MSVENVLKSIIDPETNYSITELGFIKKIEKEHIVLSPPTYWCPPMFLYMIMEEIKVKLPNITIEVSDHHDAKRLTECINSRKSFSECYSSEVSGNEYNEIKEKFITKRMKKDRLTNLSFNINGEMCKLLSEARRK
ncbi:metal-sulfur cluster biosynthetic enzyme [Acidianus brierleyi]|uniref:Metal-sulfur cluster biosynthetic enzyme n=1 Tax=Acidianus brierleyi TaxID=41673 RepID=A0A2U9II55_9CREN|nr:metal-sulfur cluster biosynthetic enzyme [Acidianus brierleyi]AWR95723.1 metal-sulfur cluster biosynthetic enzyme [Acidianus brierleyi]